MHSIEEICVIVNVQLLFKIIFLIRSLKRRGLETKQDMLMHAFI